MATINHSIKFNHLVDKQTTLIGTITSVNANGTSHVSLSGGGVMIVTGDSVPVGDVAYIKDQVIIGKSQALPTFTLDV